MKCHVNYHATEYEWVQHKTVQSDIYALGIIFYEWLTQQRLQANSYHDWAYLHCQRLHIQLPAHLQAFLPLLNRMLVKPYSRRASSIAELKLLLSG